MADNPFERSITQANKSLELAVQGYRALEQQLAAVDMAEVTTGGKEEAHYKSLTAQLEAASKSWQSAQDAVQSATEKADQASSSAKEFLPAGTPRQRLDTSAGNVLVTITETADGRGGWSLDPNTPPAKVDIPGVTPKGETSTVTAAPTGEWILKDGRLERNPAFKAPTAAPGGAVPTSEYIYDADGKPVKNVAYVPPKPDKPPDLIVNTTAKRIPDPNHPGQFMDNPNYVEPTAGAVASDAAVASTAQGVAEANLATAQAALAEAQRRARQSPTDEQAQAAITTAQKGLDLANKGLEDAQAQTAAEAPGRLAQQGATLEQTKAATDASREATAKGKLGDQYGLGDRIQHIRDMMASGELGDPSDPKTKALADNMLSAAQRGTDIYSVLKQQQSDKENARTQDVSNKNQLASSFSSTFNNSLTEFQKMNQTGAVGSDATGKAFLATLGLAQDYLKSYEQPAATPTDYLGTMVDQAQKQMAGAGGAAGVPPLPGGLPPAGLPPLPAAAPAPGGTGLLPAGMTGTAGDPLVANSPAHTQPITINIGGGQPATPSYMNGAGPGPVNAGGPPPPPPNYMNGAGPGPVNSPQGQGDRLAAAASQATMATKGEVIKTLFPRHAAQIGL